VSCFYCNAIYICSGNPAVSARSFTLFCDGHFEDFELRCFSLEPQPGDSFHFLVTPRVFRDKLALRGLVHGGLSNSSMFGVTTLYFCCHRLNLSMLSFPLFLFIS
jgi:hypothetical protein